MNALPKLLWFASVLVVLPFVLLSLYTHPQADDFWYANETLDRGYRECLAWHWQEWGGRYSSVAVIAAIPELQSAIGSDMISGYRYVGISALAFSFLAIFASVRVLAGRASSRTVLLAGSSLLFALFVTRVPSPSEEFYWMNGVSAVTAGCWLLLFQVAVMLSFSREFGSAGVPTRIARVLAGAALGLIVTGFSEPVAFAVPVIALLGVGATFVLRHSSALLWRLVLAAGIAGMALSFTAPGNAVRSDHYKDVLHTRTGLSHLDFSVPRAVIEWGTHVSAWSVDPVLLSSTILLLPVAFASNARNPFTKIKQRKSALVVFLCAWMGLVFAAFFMPLFAGGYLPPRLVNTAYHFFLMGWFACVFLCVGLFFGATRTLLLPARVRVPAQVVLLVGLFASGNFFEATSDLVRKAPDYSQDYMARYELIEQALGEGNPDLVVPPLRHATIPKTIHFRDIGLDPENWKNVECAEYFGLRSIATSRY